MPSLLPWLLGAAAFNVTLPHIHLALTFGTAGSGPALPATVIRTAVGEAADIWSPYRVVIDQTMPCASAPEEAIVLLIVTSRSPATRSAREDRALGAIDFVDGTPDSVVTVFFDELMRSIADARVLQTRLDRWPPSMRERVLGRALGRVIAHEIGHYLMASRHHSSFGLMRAVQRPDDLFGAGRVAFVLLPSDIQRLASSTKERAGTYSRPR